MAAPRRFSTLPVILVLLAAGTFFPVFTTHAAQPSEDLAEDLAASGGLVPQSGNCSAARPDDERCVPVGPQGSPQPGGPILPPTPPPVTPPVPPGTPPVVPIPLIPGRQTGPPAHPHSPIAISGYAKATLHIKDDTQDVTYIGTTNGLIFYQRPVQDMEGNTQYVWGPHQDTGLVTWKAKGIEGYCAVEGQTTVSVTLIPFQESSTGQESSTVPGMALPLDPRVPAYGYLNMVGPDGGDLYSVMVKAFNPEAKLIKTCPGDPPTVTEEPFVAGYLLHILWQKNLYAGGNIVFKGRQSYDQGDLMDFTNLLPPGTQLPQVALDALNQTSSTGGIRRYTWEWALAGPLP